MSWDDFTDFYLGQVGIMPDNFYRMTLKEVILKGESWRIQQNLDWERTRFLAAIFKNSGMVARGGKVTRLDTPTDLFSLPQDEVTAIAIQKAKQSTVEQFKSFFEKAKAKGIEFNKTPDFEKLRESHD